MIVALRSDDSNVPSGGTYHFQHNFMDKIIQVACLLRVVMRNAKILPPPSHDLRRSAYPDRNGNMVRDISGSVIYFLLEVLNPSLTDFDLRYDFPTSTNNTFELESQK